MTAGMPQLSTTTNGFLQIQKVNEVGRTVANGDQIAERKIMSPKPLRPINLLSPEDNLQKIWLPKQNEVTGLGNQNMSRTRPNIQNLFPIEKPKFLGAGGDSIQ